VSDESTNKGAAFDENEGPFTRFLRATEIDSRLLGMIGALVLIWVGFHVYGELAKGFGAFLTPRNLWNLSVQTASIGVMATGMVLVIVTRHIDLSVGSVLGFCAMFMAIMQVWILPDLLGLGHPLIWIIAVASGIAVGTLIGAFHGYLIAYLQIPAFIVTLGGLLVWRGAAFLLARGETISPVDVTFSKLGGGPYGAIGATGSWIVGGLACLGILYSLLHSRAQRRRFQFPTKPIWAEVLLGTVGCGLVVSFVLLVNSYPWPKGIVNQYVAANNITLPEDGPEAAELAGVNVRWVTLKIFALMGALAGLSAVIASARLNSATNALGTFDELYVIAAAVIGGTSLAGGIGTIYGAILGAVVMQSLQTGMVLIGFDAAMQQMVVGIVLVLAVFLDTLYRRRSD